MVNNYYVLLEGGRCDGPYTFKEAMIERTKMETFGIYCEILKVVVDVNGKEVK